MEAISKYQPSFTDISGWSKKGYSSTGGTRAKNIYTDLNGQEYFFKGSKKLKDGTFRYPLEYWSEIASSKVGKWLGFNLLDYNIGFDVNDAQQIGCLSKSMVEYSENRLSEGVDFLRGFRSSYNPDKNEDQYTVDFIKSTLKHFNLQKFESNFAEMLIFDAIIGNSDRHQENWGFISKFRETIDEIDKELYKKPNALKRIGLNAKKFMAKITLEQRKIEEEENIKPQKLTLINQSNMVINEFSPIYDSGCCLGRELVDGKIDKMLLDDQMIEAFLRKGLSEVRLEEGKKKPNHFEVVRKIKEANSTLFNKTLERINSTYSKGDLEKLINNIDQLLPENLVKFNLPENRKALMIKLIDLRIQRINNL